jgi:hypothetical protein
VFKRSNYLISLQGIIAQDHISKVACVHFHPRGQPPKKEKKQGKKTGEKNENKSHQPPAKDCTSRKKNQTCMP